jgi:hypothetical protein
VQREFSGWMAKPWRMVALHLGAWITLALLWWDDATIRFAGLTVLDWTLLTILAGCLQTIGIRLVKIVRVLQMERSKLAGAEQPPGD